MSTTRCACTPAEARTGLAATMDLCEEGSLPLHGARRCRKRGEWARRTEYLADLPPPDLRRNLECAGEAVTLEAFDVRGRQVWAREVLGQQPVSVDASGWAPGLYLVRARTGTEDVTTTIVRR